MMSTFNGAHVVRPFDEIRHVAWHPDNFITGALGAEPKIAITQNSATDFFGNDMPEWVEFSINGALSTTPVAVPTLVGSMNTSNIYLASLSYTDNAQYIVQQSYASWPPVNAWDATTGVKINLPLAGIPNITTPGEFGMVGCSDGVSVIFGTYAPPYLVKFDTTSWTVTATAAGILTSSPHSKGIARIRHQPQNISVPFFTYNYPLLDEDRVGATYFQSNDNSAFFYANVGARPPGWTYNGIIPNVSNGSTYSAIINTVPEFWDRPAYKPYKYRVHVYYGDGIASSDADFSQCALVFYDQSGFDTRVLPIPGADNTSAIWEIDMHAEGWTHVLDKILIGSVGGRVTVYAIECVFPDNDWYNP
jgi:hypothetical protein